MTIIRPLICTLPLICLPMAGTVAAAELLVDTRRIERVGAKEVPYYIPYADIMTARGDFPYSQRSPHYSPAQSASDNLMLGIDNAASLTTSAVQGSMETDFASVAGAARTDNAHAYSDGSGTKVDYGYQRRIGYLAAQRRNLQGEHVQISARRDNWEQAKLTNSAFDAPQFDQGGLNGSTTAKLTGQWLDTVEAFAGWNYLHVEADTISLRRNNGLNLGLRNDTDVLNAEIHASRNDGGSKTTFAVDVMQIYQRAKRLAPGQSWDTISSYYIPAVTDHRLGAEMDQRHDLGDDHWRMGIRYDLSMASADDLYQTPNMGGIDSASYDISPMDMYRRYYGNDMDSDVRQQAVSGRIRYDHDWTPATGFIDVRRMVRMPSNNERWYVTSGPAAMVQVGNPLIQPEKHHAVESGLISRGGGYAGYGIGSPAGAWSVQGSLTQDWVKDYISHDRARGQPGIAQSDSAVIVRNVDASISKINLNAQYQPMDHLGLRLTMTGTRGRNLTDDRPLYQMAPLETHFQMDWFQGDPRNLWHVGMDWRLVAGKRSVDSSIQDGLGADTGGSAGGFATLALYGGYRLDDRLGLTIGVDNVFDKLYREHLADYPQSVTTSLPNAAGRSVHMQMSVRF